MWSVYGASNTQNIVLILEENPLISSEPTKTSRSIKNVMKMIRFPSTKKQVLHKNLQWSYIATYKLWSLSRNHPFFTSLELLISTCLIILCTIELSPTNTVLLINFNSVHDVQRSPGVKGHILTHYYASKQSRPGSSLLHENKVLSDSPTFEFSVYGSYVEVYVLGVYRA